MRSAALAPLVARSVEDPAVLPSATMIGSGVTTGKARDAVSRRADVDVRHELTSPLHAVRLLDDVSNRSELLA